MKMKKIAILLVTLLISLITYSQKSPVINKSEVEHFEIFKINNIVKYVVMLSDKSVWYAQGDKV